MKASITTTILLCACLTTSMLSAKQISFSSPVNKVQLIELYTSQGCSSCPPAEHKLSELINSPDLWTKIVPVAFHVDYWNYLGWRDIYSDSKNTRKQQRHRALGNISSIYTPGFLVNGKEWRGFFRGNKIPSPPKVNTGKLDLTWDTATNNVNLNFNNLTNKSPSTCHFALLSFEKVHVNAGENVGLTLQQDFAAISSNSTNINIKNNQFLCSTTLAKLAASKAKHKNKKLALVGWITNKNQQQIQAVGGWI